MDEYIAKDARRAIAADDDIEAFVDQTLDGLRPQLVDLARGLRGALTPAAFFQFELALFLLLRDFGRCWLELLLNGLEGDGSGLPHDVLYLGQGYRRLGKKTRNNHVATLFGTVWDRSLNQGQFRSLEEGHSNACVSFRCAFLKPSCFSSPCLGR